MTKVEGGNAGTWLSQRAPSRAPVVTRPSHWTPPYPSQLWEPCPTTVQ